MPALEVWLLCGFLVRGASSVAWTFKKQTEWHSPRICILPRLMLKGKGLVASRMQIPLTNSLLVTASRYSCAPASLFERQAGWEE